MSNHVSDSVAILRKLAELKERQGWAHHVADAATGNLHTTELSQPITPLSRAERLSQLGHRFDRSIFGTPTHRLTPKQPYQASPTGFLGFLRPRLVSSYSDDPEGIAVWRPSADVVGELEAMANLLWELPQGPCLLTLLLASNNASGQVGHFRIEVEVPGQGGEWTVVAGLSIAEHRDHFVEHTVDLVFAPVPDFPICRVRMILQPESGLDYLQFRSLTLAGSRLQPA
jgi:hypothetical protein